MNHHILEITQEDFQDTVLNSTRPVLIEFTADWCPPCKMLVPTMNTLADKYEQVLTVGMLDADQYPSIVQQYQVMGLPTLMLFVNGEPIERIVGFTTLERIESKIVPYLKTQSLTS